MWLEKIKAKAKQNKFLVCGEGIMFSAVLPKLEILCRPKKKKVSALPGETCYVCGKL